MEELKATGNLSLLQNMELRRRIGFFEGEFERMNMLITEARLFNTALNKEIVARFEAVKYGFGLRPETILNYDLKALTSDQRFINKVSRIHANSVFIRTVQQVHVENLKSLQNFLAEILGIEVVEEEGEE